MNISIIFNNDRYDAIEVEEEPCKDCFFSSFCHDNLEYPVCEMVFGLNNHYDSKFNEIPPFYSFRKV